MATNLQRLLNDPNFTARLFSLDEPADVQALFAQNGEEVSLEEIYVLGRALSTALKPGGELSDAELESIAGGMQLNNPGAAWNNAKLFVRRALDTASRGGHVAAAKW